MSSISAIGTNHAKILTGLKDGGLCNKLAESKAKKCINMVQVLQDVADMAINFKRSRGYYLPTFDVNQVSSSNNYSSVNSYRSTKPPAKGIQQALVKADKSNCWHCQGDHLKEGLSSCPTTKHFFQPKYKLTKERQCNLVQSFHKKFQDRKSQVNEITIPSEDDSFEELDKFFSEFENMIAEDSDDMST